jgi:pimeloyl-ACP methyl ester carboxylesterase
MEPARGELQANGLRIAYLERGEGPVVVLLHGFPDNAWTWQAQLEGLAKAGYRAVAPFMRGYPPTELSPDARYEPAALADDVAGLVQALGEDAAFVAGHDWGAVAAHAAMTFAPERVRRVAVLGVGHPRMFARILVAPQLAHNSFHLWLFQLEGLAEAVLENGDFALVSYLWRFWSPHLDDAAHIDRVRRMLAEPGAKEAALGYYRALIALPREDPDQFSKLAATTNVPTLALFGADDPLAQPAPDEGQCYGAAYAQHVLPRVGHFIHRERPNQVNALLAEWFDAETADSGGARRPLAASAGDSG